VSWFDVYHSDLQQTGSLVLVPALWLGVLLFLGKSRDTAFPDARFVRLYAIAFCLETILDPIATGPLTRIFALGDTATTATMLLFVLLGDFRVYLLVSFLTRPERRLAPALREAALWTLAVPILAGGANAALAAAIPDLDGQVLWLIYEVAFVAAALLLRSRLVPARLPDSRDRVQRALRTVTGYVALYYTLWATADSLILFAGLDAGWLLRIVPNQLYYAFYVPVVCWAFFRSQK
jgi:hypothetical protein